MSRVMTSSPRNPDDVKNLTPEQWAVQLDGIRKLGDVYEKKRRIEQLLCACEEVDESELSAMARTELQTQCGRLASLLEALPTSVLEDSGAGAAACGQEVIGETLDELFGGLNLASARGEEGSSPARPMTTPSGFTEGAKVTKVVEIRPGRQYRKVLRKNGGDHGVVVHVKGTTRGRHPDTLDATSADEKEDEDIRDVQDTGVARDTRETTEARDAGDARRRGYGNDSLEDADAAQLEAARYEKDGKHGTMKPSPLEIPVDREVLARAAAGTPHENDGDEYPSSSGGSTHAIVGRNRGDWFGQVGANERRLGNGDQSESSGSESGESFMSPAVVVDSQWT